MGKHELIEAFIRGDIDRRQFVSRLTMLGVSGGAALAYASRLTVDAAAAPASAANGFKMRMQGADDDDYGTAIEIDVVEGLQQQAAAIESLVLFILDDLDNFDASDFPDGVYDTLLTIRDQQQQHFDAVQSLLQANGGESTASGDNPSISSADELLSLLAENLDDLTGLYAAIIPAMEDDESRQTLTEAGSIASRHAALASLYADRNPLPSAFQQPSIPTGL